MPISDETRFTEGDCYLLALAIHRRTGWTLCAFELFWDQETPDIHSFVRTPDGRYLDIEGLSTEAAMLKRWDDEGVTGIMEATRRQTLDFGPAAFGPYSYQRAATLAPRLIALV